MSENTQIAVSFRIVSGPNHEDTGTIAVWFWCPGCQEAHAVEIGGNNPGPKWTWNGSLEKPTFHPSILLSSNGKGQICHSYVTDGRIQFLGDCGHTLVGQTVPLPQLPEWLKDGK